MTSHLDILKKSPRYQSRFPNKVPLSPTDTTNLLDCPKKFFYSRMRPDIKPEDKPSLIVGTIIHAVINTILIGKDEGQSLDIMISRHPKYCLLEDEDQKYALSYASLIKQLLEKIQGYKLLYGEQKFSLSADGSGGPYGWCYVGTIDAVIELNRIMYILDFKTGKRKPDLEQLYTHKTKQVEIYSYAMYKKTGIIPQFRFYHMISNTKPTLYETEIGVSFKDFQRCIKNTDMIFKSIVETGNFFVNRQHRFCPYCQYKETCFAEEG